MPGSTPRGRFCADVIPCRTNQVLSHMLRGRLVDVASAQSERISTQFKRNRASVVSRC